MLPDAHLSFSPQTPSAHFALLDPIEPWRTTHSKNQNIQYLQSGTNRSDISFSSFSARIYSSRRATFSSLAWAWNSILLSSRRLRNRKERGLFTYICHGFLSLHLCSSCFINADVILCEFLQLFHLRLKLKPRFQMLPSRKLQAIARLQSRHQGNFTIQVMGSSNTFLIDIPFL